VPSTVRTRPSLAATLAAAVLAVVLVVPAMAADEVVNRVVLRVNDRIATLYDYQQRVADLTEQIARADLPLAQRRQRISEVPEQVYNELLQELLLLSRADQAGIVYTDDEVDAQLKRIRDGYGISTDEEFRQALASQGLDERSFREQVVTGMRIQELLGREVRSKLDVGEDLARAYYRDHPEVFMAPQRLRLRELVVLDDSSLSAEQRAELARSIRDELAGGRAAEELVEEYADQGSVSNLIDLGWVAGGDLAPEIQQAVWDLQPNQVSEPIPGRGGLHIVQVLEREDEALKPFADVSEEAERRATGIAFNEKLGDYLQKLERQSYVDLSPPPEAADFRRVVPDAIPVPPAATEGAGADDVAVDATPDAPVPEAPVPEAAPGTAPSTAPSTASAPPAGELPPPPDSTGGP